MQLCRCNFVFLDELLWSSQTGDAAVQLGEKGAYHVLDSKLQKLAATHINAGVTDDQFEVTMIFATANVNLNVCKVS